MSRVYVNGISSVSAQPEDIFDAAQPISYRENILLSLNQDYKSLIKPMMLRRMSKAVKMGLYCSNKALKEANIQIPDAILVGTGQGCMQDTEKFMENLLESEESLLSPTSFIQSTHNTVGGQIALNLNCKGHNMTFTQNSVSFESALMDAMLQMDGKEVRNILVGGVDETSKGFTGFQKLDRQIKGENINNLDLFNSDTAGTIISESAAFFSIGVQRNDNSYAKVQDVEIFNHVQFGHLNSKIEEFLESNNTSVSEIDAIILGKNGDARFEHYYKELQQGLFSEKCQVGFKHLVGENNSVSSYAFWLASRILKEKRIPEIFKLNSLNCDDHRKILIYNQYLGRNHGLTLLQSL